MNYKKIIAVLLSFVLLITPLSGCSKSNKDKDKPNVAMGRYVEKSIDMPEAVQSGDEIAYIMTKNPEGKIEIYASPKKHKKGEENIQYTLKKDQTWERVVPKWFNEKGMDLTSITYGADGLKYALVEIPKKDKLKIRILKSKDNQSSQDIKLNDYKGEVGYEKRPYSMQLLEDNSLLLGYANQCSVFKEGKEVVSFKIGDYSYAVSDNKLMTMTENLEGGVIIDINTGKTLSTVPLDSSYYNLFSSDKEGNWFILNGSGIQRMAKNGNTLESILDGGMASMSRPGLGIDNIVMGNHDDFYILYQGENGKRIMKYYVYDKNVPTTPSNKLTIVSLNECFIIRDAIVNFQQEHTDVQIEYRALMRENNSTTVSDQIKKINTELLAGKGADILVLDKMPVNSYIQKGVLADISDTINPLIKSGKILSNIVDNFKTEDGKIYTVPLRLTLPLAFGNKEAVNATKSINNLAAYAKTATVPLFGSKTLSCSDLTTMMFRLYSNQFLQNDHFEREGLVNFLTQLKVISDQTTTTMQQKEIPVAMEILNDTFTQLLYHNKALLGINDIYHMYSVYQPIALSELTGSTYALINELFTPHELVSVNNASKQKELAAKFITTLLEEPAQDLAMGDGFPINVNALNNFGIAEDDFVANSFDDTEVTQPKKEKMQAINDLFKKVRAPIYQNEELITMFNKETEALLTGTADVESTADKIIAKAKTYLAE